MKKSILLISLLTLFLFSCKKEETKKVEQTAKTEQTDCTYSINNQKAFVGWTAYKTTAKVGVKGQFTSVAIQNANDSKNTASLLKGVTFSIPTASTSTQDISRDQKIKESFFAVLNTPEITGEIKSIENGKVNIELTMNNISVTRPFEFATTGDSLKLTGDIDMVDWKGQPAINALNKVCYDLHKGADGVSKLWPTISINVVLPLEKTCE